MSKDISVKRSSVEEFKQKGGYRIIEPIYAADGKTVVRVKHCTLAAQKTGMSRDLIRRIVQQHPTERPRMGEFKYYAEFAEIPFMEDYERTHGTDVKYRTHVSTLRKLWKFLDKPAGFPCSLTVSDWDKVWNKESPFWNPALGRSGGIHEGYATPFHHVMDMCEHTAARKLFKGMKFTKGALKEWYLEEEDLRGKPNQPKTSLLYHLEENETLVLILLGIVEGARISSLIRQKPADINQKLGTIRCREPKMRGKEKEIVIRTIPQCVLNLVNRYIKDYQIKPQDRLFKKSDNFYREQMKHAGEQAGIVKPAAITTHIMKHTFVTQASHHGVPAELISEQTGTELRTLEAHYRAKDPKKARQHLRGEKQDIVPFIDWIRSLEPVFLDHYERIQREGAKVDDYRGKLP